MTIDIFSSAIQFHSNGDVRSAERRMTTDSGAWQIAAFHAETDEDVHADHWEMHPAAEEAVCCLSGRLRIYFRDQDEPVTLTTGQAVVVPRATWHRLELDEPSDLMSVTLRGGTRLEEVAQRA